MLSIGFLFSIFWYFISIVASWLGFTFGKKIKLKQSNLIKKVNLQDNLAYYILTVLATIGTLAAFYKIYVELGDLNRFFEIIKGGNANYFKNVLYDNYTIGLLSLRYLAIHACALAILRRILFSKKNFLDALNILNLVLVSLISSRLSFIMMLLEVMVIWISYKEIRIHFLKSISLVIIIFHILCFLNYSRNINFYKERGLGFYSGGISEIITYLGAPFQGAVSIGNNYNVIREYPMRWDKYAYIEAGLTTNSAFLYFFRYYDWWCFLNVFTFLLTLSFVSGILYNLKENYLYLSFVTLVYSFAEFWRLFWFGSGIMITLFLMPFIISFLVITIKSLPIWKK